MIDEIELFICRKCGTVFEANETNIKETVEEWESDEYICPNCKEPNTELEERIFVVSRKG